MVWLSIALTRMGSGVLQSIQLALDIRDAEQIDDAQIPGEILEHGLTVWRCKRIALPLTLGLRPRRIIVPASWDLWPAESRRAVLRHELAHIQRRDGLIQALEIFVQALFFFVPPVSWLTSAFAIA